MWNLARQHLQQDHPKAVYITRLSMGLLSQDLRSRPIQLLRRSQTVMLAMGAGCRRIRTALLLVYAAAILQVVADGVGVGRRMLGQSEVSNLDPPVLEEEGL